MRLVLATRRSALALAQSRAFAEHLKSAVPSLVIEELQVVTSGDKTQDRPLQDIGGKGLFIKELEEALLDGRADFAVHSIKDVPAEIAPSLTLACIPAREDPRDVLVSRTGAPLKALPEGARVGTSSLRRAVALLAVRPDLQITPLRGNVDTRLRKVEEGVVDVAVLALAGLKRLGLAARATEILEPEVSLPAIGQGALGIECRVDDARAHEALAAVVHPETATCVSAERAVMAAVEGNCRMPVAAHAVRAGGVLWLRAFLAEPDGSRMRTGERRVPWPQDALEAARCGEDLGAELRSA
ncbi:hydroxymethylbilane synthase [Chondromyces apiculatus]|uniref:Porphobilinogen deaminase n=1 Tax=Chondromyces apiculatus DSM 436 TaxID=1192034 RepID=A0A017T1I8_9BACT|nr:hydroxymethylbilane synthase [Chondromyces apiculatus]EYF02426.1 Porphobilinogen deaminase [Chondromyces apiculatus DSM 436]